MVFPLIAGLSDQAGVGISKSPFGLTDPGDHDVNSSLVCVITRFGLRTVFDLVLTYLDYRRVLQQAREEQASGLIRAVFLIESLTTCYSLSIWDNRRSIALFGSKVPAHLDAARRALGRLSSKHGRGPQLWSTKWQLASVSNNLNWDDMDLRSILMRRE